MSSWVNGSPAYSLLISTVKLQGGAAVLKKGGANTSI
jgi:hypothetical protein